MKKEPLTLETFRVYEDGQRSSLNAIEKGQDEIKKEQRDFRKALVKLTEIQAKAQVSESIFHEYMRDNDKNVDSLFKTMRSRESYFRFAGYVKAGLTLILAGGLGAYGQDYYKRHFAAQKQYEAKQQQIKPRTEIHEPK